MCEINFCYFWVQHSEGTDWVSMYKIQSKPAVLWLANFAQCVLFQWVTTQNSPNFNNKDMTLLFLFLKMCWIGLGAHLVVIKLFSNKVTVLAVLAQSMLLKNKYVLIIAHVQLNRVMNIHWTQPCFCGVPNAMYSSVTPIRSCL